MIGPSVKKSTCPKCEDGELRRLNRIGFMERQVLHSFGIFPWECVLCRKKTYRRDDGHAEIARRSQTRGSHQESAV
jgi:hypothetical protein